MDRLLKDNNMEREEVKKELVAIVVDKLECEDYEVKEEVRASDLGADSLDEIDMLMEIERTFGIYISDEEASKVITFGDMFELVCIKTEAL